MLTKERCAARGGAAACLLAAAVSPPRSECCYECLPSAVLPPQIECYLGSEVWLGGLLVFGECAMLVCLSNNMCLRVSSNRRVSAHFQTRRARGESIGLFPPTFAFAPLLLAVLAP